VLAFEEFGGISLGHERKLTHIAHTVQANRRNQTTRPSFLDLSRR
jgi:hypothetical protein